MALEEQVVAHYAGDDRAAAIFAALAAAGKDLNNLTVDDLAPIDEFHVRGRQATVELGRSLALRAGMHVLDAGCGIGGASRFFAATYGCRVTGIDLTEEYCRVAALLAKRTGLAGSLEYRQGSVVAMPFEDESFDAAYTQHAAMNVPDKAGFYREVARLLKPKGRFGIYDILRGPGGEVIFPVPWAHDASTSFLATPEEMRSLLEAAGFRLETERDTTVEGRAFFEALFARIAESGPPPLGVHVLMPNFRPLVENLLRSMAEERVVVAEIVCRKS